MQRPALELVTERLFVQVPPVQAARRVAEYCRRNRDHLAQWEPPRSDEYYGTHFWERQIAASRAEYEQGNSIRSVLIRRDPRGKDGGRFGDVIGVINLSQIVRGGFQAGIIGYSLDGEQQNQGLRGEGLAAVIEFAFIELGLHRIMANFRPENERSARVLERLGFEREGYAKEYLYIDGAWRDHVLTSLIRPTGGMGRRQGQMVRTIDENANLTRLEQDQEKARRR